MATNPCLIQLKYFKSQINIYYGQMCENMFTNYIINPRKKMSTKYNL